MLGLRVSCSELFQHHLLREATPFQNYFSSHRDGPQFSVVPNMHWEQLRGEGTSSSRSWSLFSGLGPAHLMTSTSGMKNCGQQPDSSGIMEFLMLRVKSVCVGAFFCSGLRLWNRLLRSQGPSQNAPPCPPSAQCVSLTWLLSHKCACLKICVTLPQKISLSLSVT